MKNDTNTELMLTVKGEIVASNFAEFKVAITDQLKEINTDLNTDADFGRAEMDVKALKLVEKVSMDAKAEAIKQMESVNELFSGIDSMSAEVRTARLDLERKIKARKAEVKREIEDDALALIDSKNRNNYRQLITESMKGKKTIESLINSANAAAGVIVERHSTNEAIIAEFTESHGATLVPDHARLIDLADGSLREQLERRVELADAEAKRKKLSDELAEMKRKESAEKKEDIPEPKKVDTIPVGKKPITDDDGEDKEFSEFIDAVKLSFLSVKEKRESLKYENNKAKAQSFADELIPAWLKLTK